MIYRGIDVKTLSVAYVLGIHFLASLTMAQPPTVNGLLIRHVGVIDTRDGKLLEDRDVEIAGDRIVSVKPAALADISGSHMLVDGRGKYLIPGLWDCHIHLSWTTQSALPLLTALGVTEVRDLGGKLTELEDWRARIRDGSLTGPHIMRVGPILNGKSFNPYQCVSGSAEATRGA